MMTQSEAERQITRILSDLEKDQGVVVESLEVCTFDISTLCRTMKRKRAAITLSYLPHVAWDLD